jgi:hypothetical protein
MYWPDNQQFILPIPGDLENVIPFLYTWWKKLKESQFTISSHILFLALLPLHNYALSVKTMTLTNYVSGHNSTFFMWNSSA